MGPRPILICAAALFLACAPAAARTVEGFTLSAKAGFGFDSPHPAYDHGFGGAAFLISPGLHLFENRLTVELDMGMAHRPYRSVSEDWVWSSYRTRGDTLFRTSRTYRETSEELRFHYAWKAGLNRGSWTWYAGSLILVTFTQGRREGQVITEATTGGLDGFEPRSTRPLDEEISWGYGIVNPVYGLTRRFGAIGLFAQGIGLVAVQAGVSLTWRPPGAIAPH